MSVRAPDCAGEGLFKKPTQQCAKQSAYIHIDVHSHRHMYTHLAQEDSVRIVQGASFWYLSIAVVLDKHHSSVDEVAWMYARIDVQMCTYIY